MRRTGFVFHWFVALVWVGSMFLTGTGVRVAAANPAPVERAGTVVLHVATATDLQTAINQVQDGGVIELESGTYYAPSGGFLNNDTQKSFTLRAASGAQVFLDGRNQTDIFRFINSSLSRGRPVTFEDLTFQNGWTNLGGLGAAVSLQNAEATFINCTFQNNNSGRGASAGAVAILIHSRAFFFNSNWYNNTAGFTGGGLGVEEFSAAYIHTARFVNNRTNVPYHHAAAAGGAIHAGNSTLRVSNTRFENNQAGYVGGAIYALGSWSDPVSTPRTDVIVANSTFINNHAARDATVQSSLPTEAGAFHAENQTTARIYNSRFIDNSADCGGAINLYRSIVEMDGIYFKGNHAVGSGAQTGFGGVANITSNDIPSDGNVNYRSSSFTLRNSWVQGGGVVAQSSGGIAVAGDGNRTYGINGVSQMGTVETNSAQLILENVALVDLDVQNSPNIPGSGNGGAVTTDLTNARVTNSMVILSDAIGTSYSSGGGFSVLDQSTLQVVDGIFSQNTSDLYGAALFVQGSLLEVEHSQFLHNQVSPGVAEKVYASFGAVLFAAPDLGRGFYVMGNLENSILADNDGLPLFDQDSSSGPINGIQYNNNQIHSATFPPGIIYCNNLPGYCGLDVAELNAATVVRTMGINTQKAAIANIPLGYVPSTGGLKSLPPARFSVAAPGDTVPTPSYLVYAWSGNAATLDGIPQALTTAFEEAAVGAHTLNVDGVVYSARTQEGVTPEGAVEYNVVTGGASLSWAVNSGTFLEAVIDQGVGVVSAANGSVSVPSSPGRPYHFYAITQEGGIYKTVETGQPILDVPSSQALFASLDSVTNNGAVTILNLGAGEYNWTAQTDTPDLINLETTQGTVKNLGVIHFTVNTGDREPGVYIGHIEIDAGSLGSKQVEVQVNVATNVSRLYSPLTLR